ncbi:MAG TPA: AMP-binding protein [Burkholderiales bacterium]
MPAERLSDAALRDLPLEDRVLAPIFRQRIEQDADRPFLRFGSEHYTYGQFAERTLAFARGLARLGIGKGSIVPILLPNCAQYVMAWFAVQLRGAAMALLNPALKGRLLENALVDCDPRVVIAGGDALAQVAALTRERCKHLGTIIAVGPGSGVSDSRLVSFETIGEKGGADPIADASFDDVQAIFFTSGSTGPAKGVLMPNAHFFGNPCSFMRLSGLSREDVLHTSLPLFHGVGSRQGVLPAFMIGAQACLGAKFSASRFWQTVSEEQATIALLTPSMPPILAALAPGRFDRGHRLRAIYNVPHDAAFEERFGVRMLTSFAITEIGVVIYTPYPERRLGAMGVAHEDWELAIVDEMDRPLGDDRQGQLVCRPKKPYLMMQGYLNRPEAAAAAWRNLWYHTGDFMRRDADGYFYFTGRDKDRIRRRGENISPLEIESELRHHPAIADCVAVPFPARDGEDDIRAIVVAREAMALPAFAELYGWLAARLPPNMMPRYFEIAPALPMTATDKVDRRALRDAPLGDGFWDREAQPS